MALILSALSLMNFLLWLLQTVFYGRRIARTEIRQPPVFVLGHWRSGTTLLHELSGLRPAAHLSQHVRLLLPEPLSALDAAVHLVARGR